MTAQLATPRRPIRWADAAPDSPLASLVLERQHYARNGRSTVGRSEVLIDCPFCKDQVTAYAWSLAGRGKRCDCGALHGSLGGSIQWAEHLR